MIFSRQRCLTVVKKEDDIIMDMREFENYHAPVKCSKCGGISLNYNGLGEYCCEKCGYLEYDDYGKVRNYLEHQKKAPIAVISRDTGVSKAIIRQMVEENRFELTSASKKTLD